MSLSEAVLQKQFGKTTPRELREYDGNNQLIYEGYAAAHTPTSSLTGWVIIAHTLVGSPPMDTESDPLYGVCWDLRAVYTYFP